LSKIFIETPKPIAYDSPDHIEPVGTAADNSTSRRFNAKLFRLIPPNEVRLLDVGCSGGGLVKSILDDGGFAVGIEGSDYSLRHKRAEWATIPDHLFTTDATVPFQLSEEAGAGKTPLQFNVITAWEFFEHIAEEHIAGIVANILRHLAPRGIVLASIAPYEQVTENGVRLHQTVQQKPWWIDTFSKLGLQNRPEIEDYFHFDWVRGAPDDISFPVAFTRKGEEPIHGERLNSLRLWNKPYEFLRSVYRLRRKLKS
jgi:Methyltransferase domain